MNIHRLMSAGMAALLLVAVQASASHISGLRITPTGAAADDPLQIEGLSVDVDITAFYTTGSTASEAYLGTYYGVVPAVDWGDGNTVAPYGLGPSTGLPLVATSTVVDGVPARAYRGSFSHTYSSEGPYTISANTRCCPVTTPTQTVVTGAIVTTTVATTGAFGPTTFTTSFVQDMLNVVVGFVAQAQPGSPESIPGLTGGGIILLAGLAALTGLLFSRRRGAKQS
ncbi:MAG: hypothetical protein AAGI11_06445 [Pseudomonadota bacterium]